MRLHREGLRSSSRACVGTAHPPAGLGSGTISRCAELRCMCAAAQTPSGRHPRQGQLLGEVCACTGRACGAAAGHALVPPTRQPGGWAAAPFPAVQSHAACALLPRLPQADPLGKASWWVRCAGSPAVTAGAASHRTAIPAVAASTCTAQRCTTAPSALPVLTAAPSNSSCSVLAGLFAMAGQQALPATGLRCLPLGCAAAGATAAAARQSQQAPASGACRWPRCPSHHHTGVA